MQERNEETKGQNEGTWKRKISHLISSHVKRKISHLISSPPAAVVDEDEQNNTTQQ
jgi:hypothetical protein